MTDKPNKRKGNPALVKGMKPLNPNGRPKGSVNKYTALARQMMSEQGTAVVQKVINKALEGDVHCLKMCIDRILPVHKAIDPNRARQDSQIIINVGASDAIHAKIAETPAEEIVNPKTKTDDEIIIEVGEVVENNKRTA